MRRKGAKVASDERTLGSRDFVEGLLAEAARREKETLRLGVPPRHRAAVGAHRSHLHERVNPGQAGGV